MTFTSDSGAEAGRRSGEARRARAARLARIEAWTAARKATTFDKQTALDGLAYFASGEHITDEDRRVIGALNVYLRHAPEPRLSAEHQAQRRSRADELLRGIVRD